MSASQRSTYFHAIYEQRQNSDYSAYNAFSQFSLKLEFPWIWVEKRPECAKFISAKDVMKIYFSYPNISLHMARTEEPISSHERPCGVIRIKLSTLRVEYTMLSRSLTDFDRRREQWTGTHIHINSPFISVCQFLLFVILVLLHIRLFDSCLYSSFSKTVDAEAIDRNNSLRFKCG